MILSLSQDPDLSTLSALGHEYFIGESKDSVTMTTNLD